MLFRSEESHTHEKIFKLKRVKTEKHDGWAIQGHTRLHLTCELDNRVTLDRPWARGFEMWDFEFLASNQVVLKSLRNNKFITVFSDHQSLVANVDEATEATKWVMYIVQNCSSDDSCWGPLVRNAPISDDALDEELKAIEKLSFPLFGSPKPVAKLEPTNADDPYDPFIIARRTLDNWGSIPGMTPVIYANDPNTIALVEDSNRFHPNQTIRIEEQFEIHTKFSQPTYRGLFSKTLKLFPDAPAIMYSNSDILYTPSVPETMRNVMKYVAKERRRISSIPGATYKVKGWMLVGQRINHNVPAEWQIRNQSSSTFQRKNKKSKKKKATSAHLLPWWVDDIEDHFSNRGQLFQSNAEDYFIVSRDLFDWDKEIGDFVVGGVAFDNWIVARAVRMALRGEAIVVDTSKTITALHQNHGSDVKDSHKHPKSIYNSHLAAKTGGVSGGKTADAAYATERRPDGTITVYDKHRLLYK